ncbi:MAPEG family protein [Cognatiyoonia sp. IB215446]|uniref:MAPEG family protein n=1 Tax=Cognatiyoonia sp. IB215446 TaxID=3097355 RepID=UPI002A169D5E|nr:MAPEG family protein [Cognatiyoonia sp. IB215446]MDX8348092.1 MAPEG family protein [Cognatiyoonia sp. IB215446]
MTFWILAALALYFVQTLLPPMFRYMLQPDPQILATLGPRDNPPETSIYGARSERALRNSGEALLIFLPLALLGAEKEGALLGAQIFVLCRLAYLPAYILGIPFLRSLVWTLGVSGLVLMAAAAVGPA